MDTSMLHEIDLVDDLSAAILDRFDSVYGTISGGCSKGVFLVLENGQQAFAYGYVLRPGTRVLCSVQRLPHENLYMRVSIDSVLYDLNPGLAS